MEDTLSNPVKFSKRERQVLALLRNGAKNKAIAFTLGLNEKTISTYKIRVLKKMGIHSEQVNDYVIVTLAVHYEVIEDQDLTLEQILLIEKK